VNFFEHFSSHLSKEGEQLDRWCKNIRIQEKLRIGIDGNGRFADPKLLERLGPVIEMEKTG
jgi:hypothetical protein